MNRKKINKIALMAGIVVGVNLSSSLSSFAVQKDADDSTVQIMQEKSAEAENTITEAESSTDELEDKTDNTDNTVIEAEDDLSDEEEVEETEEDTVELYDAYNVSQAVNNINSGIGTQYDYRALRIKSVNNTNVYFANKAVAKAKDDKSDDLIKSEIITTVNDAMDVYNFLVFINDATVDDYDYIWLTGVDESNIEDFNNLLADKYLDRHEMPVFATVDDLQLSIDNISDSIEAISEGSGTIEDYNNIGITDVTENNLSKINKMAASESQGKSLSISEIKELINSQPDSSEAMQRINNGEATLKDYEDIGAEGVNEENIQFVDSSLKGSNDYEIDSLLTRVEKVVKAYNTIKNIENGQATLDDYMILGICGVNSENIEYINESLSGSTFEAIYQIQSAVDKALHTFYCINRINAGNAALSDYMVLGITGVTPENLMYLNTELKGKGYTDREEIQSAVDKALHTFDCINSINAGNATVEDYMVLGIIGVTSENLMYLNTELKGRGYTDREEIQSAVDKALHTFYCINRINAGNAILSDYMVLGITGVTPENLMYLNTELKGKGYTDREEIQSAVDNALHTFDCINRINNGTAVLDDYMFLGITGVTVENLEYVNICLEGQRYTNNSEIQAAVQKAVNNDQYISRINNGTASLDDYMMMGVTGVNEENISYVNSEIKGTINVAASNIQSQVDSIVKSYSDIYAINRGYETRTSDNYVRQYLDITGTKVVFDTTEDSQFSLIRECILISRKINNGRDLTKSEITSIIDRVVSEYEDAKVIIKEVKSEYDKAYLAVERDLTPEEMDRIIEVVKDKRANIVDRIYLGCGTVDDFNEIGETRVTADNIDVINEDIKKSASVRRASEYRLENLDEAVTKGIAVYNINKNVLSGNSYGNIDEFAKLGIDIVYSTDPESYYRLVEDMILIRQKIEGCNLSRNEILDANEQVSDKIEDCAIILPKTCEKIVTAERDMGIELSSDEVEEIFDQVRDTYKKACVRIASGKGTIDDYKLYGESRVNYNNIESINIDIMQFRTTTTLSDYRLANLDEAVTKGIAIYNINTGVETKDTDGYVKEFKVLGVNIESSTEALSVNGLVNSGIIIQRRINDQQLLTREEILDVIKQVEDNPDAAKVKIPMILSAINEKDMQEDRMITGDEVQTIVDECLKNN